MLIGRIRGRPVIAYSSLEEAASMKSCLACDLYTESKPCRLYAHCRASNNSDEEPRSFRQTTIDVMRSRMTIVNKGDTNGLKFHSLHRQAWQGPR